MNRLLLTVVFPLVTLPVASGCAVDAAADDVVQDAEALSKKTYTDATLLWEGNWSYLTSCDSYSKKAGRVVFTCDEKPSRTMVDDGLWIAAPSSVFTRKLCQSTATVCKGKTCVEAKVVERSVTSDKWEGSTAVLTALGENAGYKTCSHSWGTVTGVTVKF